MHIESLRHKGLRQLYLDDIRKGVPANLVDKLRKQLLRWKQPKTSTL